MYTKRNNNNWAVKKFIEEETNKPNESMSESNESIHQIKEVKAFDEIGKTIK